MAACPADTTTPRRALNCKTCPRDAFEAGHLDAFPTIIDDEAAQAGDGDNFNLEHELELIMEDEEVGNININAHPPDEVANTHGGLMLQIGELIWCQRCGASATLGNTSIYLRRPCDGKPANLSMERRKGRLIRKKHPTTCASLNGSHKRVRFE